MTPLGAFGIRCPDCGDVVPVTVQVDAWVDEETGEAQWEVSTDDADVYAHVWSHDPELASPLDG